MDFVFPNKSDLDHLFQEKYANRGGDAWGPDTRHAFGYYTPDDYYEAIIDKLVQPECRWLDVGCGRDIFPSNAGLARSIADRCRAVVGIDPDPNINDNPFLTEAHNVPIEEYESEEKFDLITLRMVAEHIANPSTTLRVLSNLAKPGGAVVIYTPHKWAPVSIIARITPMAMHHWVKSIIWETEERDTFPVEYKMNTRRTLRELFKRADFNELSYSLIDDCRIFNNYRLLNKLDLTIWQLCRMTRIPYPEKCIIGVYAKSAE